MSTEPIDIDALVVDLQDALAERQRDMKGGGALYSRAIFGLVYLSYDLARARECINQARELARLGDDQQDMDYLFRILDAYEKGPSDVPQEPSARMIDTYSHEDLRAAFGITEEGSQDEPSEPLWADEIRAMHHEKHGENERGPYVICDYDKTPWPCLTYRIINKKAENNE